MSPADWRLLAHLQWLQVLVLVALAAACAAEGWVLATVVAGAAVVAAVGLQGAYAARGRQ